MRKTYYFNTIQEAEKYAPIKPDTLCYIQEEEKYYIRNEHQELIEAPIDIQMQDLEISLYEINRQIISQLLPLDTYSEKIELINKFEKEFHNHYYMLYGKEISYFTVMVKNNNIISNETFGDIIIDCLSNLGEIRSIELTSNEDAIEIWLKEKEENIITCLYLFPYDNGIVEYRG